MKLDDVRKKIDDLDEKIIQLLEKRLSLARKAKAAKEQMGKKLHDPSREHDVITNAVAQASVHGVNEKFIKTIFKEILEESRRLQKE
jgi:chorismate mutase